MQFAVVLNEKKKRIVELEKELADLKGTTYNDPNEEEDKDEEGEQEEEQSQACHSTDVLTRGNCIDSQVDSMPKQS